MNKPRHPFTALPDNLFGILKGHEWAVMMALAHHGYSSYPSQQRIAKLAGISLTTTQKVLNSLKEKGLVEWEHRKREDGGQGSNLYRLTIDHLWNPEGVSATRVPPTRDTGTPHPRDTDEQDLLEPDLKEPIEPPLPPAPPKTRGEALSVKVIPPDLQPVRNEILTFWDEHKGGRKTQKAWDDQMSQLLKILHDREGGLKAVAAQLEKAKEASIHHKPWQAITYRNWESYGKVTKSASTNGKGYSPDAPRPGPPIEKETLESIRKKQGIVL